MIDPSNPFIKAALLAAFEKNVQEVGNYFSSLPVEIFFLRHSNKWSPAENLLHLIKSVSPVAKAMNLPKWILKILFGQPQATSRSYLQIKEVYQHELANGAQAPGRFIPLLAETLQSENDKQALLEKWRTKGDLLMHTLQNWRDEQLDQYRLPHPLLGKLTIREMLFFTLYHNQHHVNNVEKSLGRNLSSL